MALERAVVGALTHAELVDLVVRQAALIDELRATVAEQQALIGRLEARVRELERERDRDGVLRPVVAVESVDGRGVARIPCPTCGRVRAWVPSVPTPDFAGPAASLG